MKVLALGGDGIGPEVVGAGLDVLDCVAEVEKLDIEVEEDLLHGAAYDKYGTFCRDETVVAAKAADAVLVGSVGGPKWDNLNVGETPADKDGLVRLRQELDVYSGLRPARAHASLLSHTPFRDHVVSGVDVMVLRELCGGIYFGTPRGIDELEDGTFRAYDTNLYTSHEIERIVRDGFELARRRRGDLVSTDKANVMESGVLWRRIADELAPQYPDVTLRHMYADNLLYQLVRAPSSFDVIVADNLFGDLISDLAGAISGSLGMLPSASLARLAPPGEPSSPGIYEAVHGTAPDIAGLGIANPIGTILSVAMMLEYGFARRDLANKIEVAVERTLIAGIATPDIGGDAKTADITDSVVAQYRAQ